MLNLFKRFQIGNTAKRLFSYSVGGLKKFAPPNIVVVQGKTGQSSVIREFLLRHYLVDDPLLVAAGVNKNEQLLDFWLRGLTPELNLMAVKPDDGKVLAIACNTVITKESVKNIHEQAAASIEDKKAYRVACFFADVTTKAKLFSRFDIKEQMECTFIATHPDARRKGLATHLVLHSVALGKSIGYPLIRMDCTNNNSAKIAKRIKMEMLPRRQIVDYVDKEGTPWIAQAPAPPNHHMDIYFARLRNDLYSRFPPPPPEKPKKKKGFFS